MIFVAVITLFIALMYLWMGAMIFFKGQAGLIGNFYADEKAGKFDRAYAKRVGLIQLCSGLICLAAGVLGLTVLHGWAAALTMAGSIMLSLLAYRVHYQKSARGQEKADGVQRA